MSADPGNSLLKVISLLIFNFFLLSLCVHKETYSGSKHGEWENFNSKGWYEMSSTYVDETKYSYAGCLWSSGV